MNKLNALTAHCSGGVLRFCRLKRTGKVCHFFDVMPGAPVLNAFGNALDSPRIGVAGRANLDRSSSSNQKLDSMSEIASAPAVCAQRAIAGIEVTLGDSLTITGRVAICFDRQTNSSRLA
jgi:hypothetical protein